jgi:aspartate/methionine/tyrosine aminotransferase
MDMLDKAGFIPLRPQGGYFVIADWRANSAVPGDIANDVDFAKWLIAEVGVACIPPSAFYAEAEKHRVAHLARFAVCKKDETLRAAALRFETVRTGIKSVV